MSSAHKENVRVRFAPSPTGHLHIGGLRAALFNWLFARHTQGTYLVRIEDTDLERSKKEYTDAIIAAFKWVSLESDEPLVIQSHHAAHHKAVAEQLIKEGKAYRCYCPAPAENAQESAGVMYKKYDRTCRDLGRNDTSIAHVIRFKIPDNRDHISWEDLIRGTITFDVAELDDFVIVRSDGSPMYNFVVVVDDATMRITHVIRGEEHISNTPKQILLYQACDYALPLFAHLPVILNASGQKLSKRDGATSVIEYKAMGYLPDALVNYLVRLGWSHGDQEIFTRKELIDYFSLREVGKKGSIFDQDKLDWINSVYMRAMDNEALYAYIVANVIIDLPQQLHAWRQEQIIALIALYKERTKTLQELFRGLLDLHTPPKSYPEKEIELYTTPATTTYLAELIKTLEAIDDFTVDLLSDTLKALCKRLDIKLVSLAQPIRLALVGNITSPSVFELLAILGKSESIQRLHMLQRYLEKSRYPLT